MGDASRHASSGAAVDRSLASFRATPRQALGRGLYVASWVAVVLTVLSCLIGTGVGLAQPGLSGSAAVRWILATVDLLAVTVVVGGLTGLGVCRRMGTDVDETGLLLRPARRSGRHAWQEITDLRAERHGARIEIRAYLDPGGFARLSAPYDGALLAADAAFEHKYLILRQAWEAHRRWSPSA